MPAIITHDKDTDSQSRASRGRKNKKKEIKVCGFYQPGLVCPGFSLPTLCLCSNLGEPLLGFRTCSAERARTSQELCADKPVSLLNAVIKDSPKTCDSIKSFSYHYCLLPLICLIVGAWEQPWLPEQPIQCKASKHLQKNATQVHSSVEFYLYIYFFPILAKCIKHKYIF